MNNDALVKRDRMRFTKNSLSSSLALLAIVADVFYFVNIYQTNLSYYYTWQIGVSVLVNLVFLLIVFLSSEGVKNYKMSYSIVLVLVGIAQFARVLGLPTQAHNAEVAGGTEIIHAMGDKQYMTLIIYLGISGVLLIAAGVIGAVRSKMLSDYQRMLADRQKKTAEQTV